MNRQWGNSPWRRQAIAPRPLEASTPDVAIVGCGLTGASAAYDLARRGWRVVVLEADYVGNGASGRSAGLVLDGAARGGLDGTGGCIAALERVVREARIECRLRLNGYWQLVRGGNQFERRLPWRDGGAELNVARTLPGGSVDPMALLHGLAEAASGAGAIIHEHARVDRILFGERPVVECGGASIEPRFAIVAVGPWAPELVPPPPMNIGRVLAVATSPLSPRTIQDLGLWSAPPFILADKPPFWGRPLGDGRIVFGGEFVAAADSDSAIEEGFARLENRVRGLHSKPKPVRLSARWSAPAAFPHDLAPRMGPPPEAPRVFAAFGYSNHGVALPVWAGQQIAAAIMDERPLPRWSALLSA